MWKILLEQNSVWEKTVRRARSPSVKMIPHSSIFTLWLLLSLHTSGSARVLNLFGSNVLDADPTHSLDHSADLSDNLGRMFDSGEGCDLLLFVGSESSKEGADVTVCAHRVILSQFPRFNASQASTSMTVNVGKSCQQHFIPFIRYLYTRKVDMTFSSVQCFHSMASTFGVKQLMEDSGRLFHEILVEDASFHSQLSLFEYAMEAGDSQLQEDCLQFLAWNFQNLTTSRAWPNISIKVLTALLPRSDLVLPDEYTLLQSVEGWITERANMTSFECQVELLSHVRFPMISPEKLYELENSSALYKTHTNMYRDYILKALQFNVLPFSKLISNPRFDKQSVNYQPRIYTSEPWGVEIDPSKPAPAPYIHPYRPSYNRRHRYGGFDYYDEPTPSPRYFPLTESFKTPAHNSLILKQETVAWEANVFKKQEECSGKGVRCDSLPMLKLSSSYQSSFDNVRFDNRLVQMCQGKHVSTVRYFVNDVVALAANGTQATYSCAEDEYTYRLVVRPEYF